VNGSNGSRPILDDKGPQDLALGVSWRDLVGVSYVRTATSARCSAGARWARGPAVAAIETGMALARISKSSRTDAVIARGDLSNQRSRSSARADRAEAQVAAAIRAGRPVITRRRCQSMVSAAPSAPVWT
jgi:hypothetical protein